MSNTMLIAIGAALVIVFFLVIGIYNSLVALKNQVKNAWAQIEVQLKRRHDLIPNLIESVKGYMAHEASTLENVTKARQQAINISGDAKIQAQAENVLSGALKSLFAVAESYPDLKANQNFLQLQEELVSTENRISFARQAYNDGVMEYNNKKEVFPNNIIVGSFNFPAFNFFEIENAAEREVPKVQF